MNSVRSIVLAICFSPALTSRSHCSLWGPPDCVDNLRQPAADAQHHGRPRGVLKLDTAAARHHLRDTMDDEIQSLKENGTWKEVHPPVGRRIVDSKWVFKIKQKADGSIERYKAHLVVKGFSQQFGSNYEETFTPVAGYDSFKFLLAIAAYNGWKPQQMDVKRAFLYGTLKEEIYLRLPEGYRMQGMVARLYKCIYGLKQSARKWNKCLSTLLQQIRLLSSEFDLCVFIYTANSTFISTYVDDLDIFGTTNPFIKEVKDKLSIRFKCKDLGNARYILGLEITYTPTDIGISQLAYIHKILHLKNRTCLRSMVVFRWKSLGAPKVSRRAWSLCGCIWMLCAPLSVFRRDLTTTHCSRNTHKATLHPPVYAWSFIQHPVSVTYSSVTIQALLYSSSGSPKRWYNLHCNFCSLQDGLQIYIGNISYYMHIRKAHAVLVKFLHASRMPRGFMIPSFSTLGLTWANTVCYVRTG